MCNAAGCKSCSSALFQHSVFYSACRGLPSQAPDMATVAVYPGLLPCFGSGTTQVWVPGMEHHVRFQRWGLALRPPDPVHVSEHSGGPCSLPVFSHRSETPRLVEVRSSECPSLGDTHNRYCSLWQCTVHTPGSAVHFMPPMCICEPAFPGSSSEFWFHMAIRMRQWLRTNICNSFTLLLCCFYHT